MRSTVHTPADDAPMVTEISHLDDVLITTYGGQMIQTHAKSVED
jgi:hypothetical protein